MTVPSTPDSPFAFGNISVIVPNEDTTMFIPDSHTYQYTEVHTRSIKEALARLKTSCTLGSFPRRKTLALVLSTPGCVYDIPTCVLPRPLKQGTVKAGTEFIIDFCKAIVDHVVVQESNEIMVVLQEDGPSGVGPIAVKSQSPMGSLAWEYDVLCKINDRAQNEGPRSIISTTPFPSALSFVFLADGALLTTSMESKPRLNLSDLKLAYDVSGEEIPEVLILHYTARMLYYIEMLHWQAKVLVCSDHSQR
jgi:hypothetical protein